MGETRSGLGRTGLKRLILGRGESLVASAGLSLATLLMLALAGSAWWTLTVQRDRDNAAATKRIESVTTLLGETSGALLADDNLSALRRLVIQTAADHHLESCRVTLPNGVVVADADVKRITATEVPADWPSSTQRASAAPAVTHDENESIAATHVFRVPGKGVAQLEIEAPVPAVFWSSWETQAGLGAFGVVTLAGLFLVYRRLRVRLDGLATIREALFASANGETSPTELTVKADNCSEADAWNELINDVAELRRAAAGEQARAMLGDRRSGTAGLDSACDVMSQGIILIDDALKVHYANGAAAVFLQTPRDELTDSEISPFIVNTDVMDAVRGAASGDLRSRKQFEIDRDDSDDRSGTCGSLRFTVRPVRREDSASAMIIIEDITQQRVAEESRHAFVAQATHELRTPLTNIRLYAETAIDEGADDAKVRGDCLNVINTESRRLERIVADMLSVAEIEAGSLQLRRDDVRLRDMFTQLENDYRAQAADKNITFALNLPPKLPVVQGDQDKLVLALHNLVGNALKYTPDGGQVKVNVECDDGQISVEVADTGIGIGEDDAAHVFDKFYRAKDKRLGEITGSGLGLALAREVVRMHGGDITVESELNKGSRFTMTLPALAEAA